MNKYNWNYPTNMWVGENRIDDIAEACKNLSITKPLFVTDKGLAKSEIVKKTLLILDDNSVSAELYSEFVKAIAISFILFSPTHIVVG